LRIADEAATGLRVAGEALRGAPATIGVDSFGADYCLLDGSGALMGLPRHMRDPRTRGLYDEIYRTILPSELYARTGAMEIEINTLAQLVAERREQPWLQQNAASLLFVPDFIAWILSGRLVSEVTIASTSQLVDPTTRGWALDVAERLGIPSRLFNPLVEPGTTIGPIQPSLLGTLGLAAGSLAVASASHDTSTAVAAAPLADDAAFISLGTWSLLGRELPTPILSAAALRDNFTNECGAGGRIVFHKILIGLWLLQECRRRWLIEQPHLDHGAIHAAATRQPPLQFVFDVADARFVAPDDMLEAIASWFRERDRPPPQSHGEVARAIYDSLAMSYRPAVDALEEITGASIKSVHIFGGGALASVLCQATADATGRSVTAGPVEAAVAGNMICQLIARGRLRDIDDGRAMMRRSCDLASYQPVDAASWDAAWRRLRETSAP
jgi:rhamnulokinase